MAACISRVDAAIVQHEINHLDGVLLTDLPATISAEERRQKKEKRRQQLRDDKRAIKHTIAQMPRKMNPKKQAEFEKQMKKIKKAERQRIQQEEAERFRMVQMGLRQEVKKSLVSATDSETPASSEKSSENIDELSSARQEGIDSTLA